MIFKVFNIIGWDGSIGDYDLVELALTEEYTKEKVVKGSDLYLEGTNDMTLEEILNEVWDKRNIDLFIKKYPELEHHTFKIFNEITANEDYIINYKPL